jgi:predicted permease
MLSHIRRSFLRLVASIRPGRADREVRREIASHLAFLEDDYRRRGLPPEEARIAARRALGTPGRIAQLHRDARSWPSMEETLLDVRYAVRSLTRSRGFTAVALVTIALAVGTTTTLFSIGYGVLSRPLPWPEADRLVRLEERRGGNPGRIPWTISNAAYHAWREHATTIEGLGAWRAHQMTLTGQGDARRLMVTAATPGLFAVLRARPVLGRLFVETAPEAPAPDEIILSFGLWQRGFGGRSDAIGRTVQLDGRTLTIVGVMPREFGFPDRETDGWLPMGVIPVPAADGVKRVMIVPALARLRPGVTAAQAAAEGTARVLAGDSIGTAGLALFGSGGPASITAAGAVEVLTAEVRPALIRLIAAVTLLFLAATSSVVLLQIARAAARRREMAVRMAIGAGAGRIARAWLIESLTLGLAGGALGVAAALLAHRALPALLPSGFPRLDDVRLDARVAWFAAAISVAAGMAAGLVPALQTWRSSLTAALGEHGPSGSDTSARSAGRRLRALLMVSQVAVACVLLAGTGLLARSFVALLDADRGYDPHGLLTAVLPLPRQSTFEQRAPMMADLEARLSAMPGVTHVAFGNALPFVTTGGFRGVDVPSPSKPGTRIQLQSIVRAVTPAYFGALRLRLAAGRTLDETDSGISRRVIVVNRSFAREYLGPEPVGKLVALGIGDTRDWEVVGVVDDMRQGSITGTPPAAFGGLDAAPQPEAFFASTQWRGPIEQLIVLVRTTSDPTALAPAVRETLHERDPSLPIDSLMTMDDRVWESLARPRTYAMVLSVFAACALTIAAAGLFGVLSYTTARRTREIGVRSALGASPADIVRLVLREGLAVTLSGIGIGLLLAAVLARSMSTVVYGISTRDLVSFAVPPLLLLLAALAACAAPALRAGRIDPMAALRSDT